MLTNKNKVSIVFITTGLTSSIFLSLVLPEEKLAIALPAPAALIGAGLTQWSSNKEE